MGSYPTSPRSAFLTWCQAHTSVFSANAAAIGLTPAQATAFASAVSTAAAATTAQETARLAAKAATEDCTAAYGELRSQAAECVRTIRTFAENTENPKVYQTAQISPPAPPGPLPAPSQPTDLGVLLDPTTGLLTLKWKATNPPGASGTAYIIRRKLPGQSSFQFVGVTGTKRFTDATLVAGPDSVQYTVQGQRADQAGAVSNILTVNFGQAPGGGFTATAVEGDGGEMKLAA